MEKGYEVAVTFSPKGWKQVKKIWLEMEDGLEVEDNYYEEEGWQLWYWRNLSQEQATLIEHCVVEVSAEECRMVRINSQTKNGEQVGEVTGPFDLVMGTRGPHAPGHWMHIDPEYKKYFFREC